MDNTKGIGRGNASTPSVSKGKNYFLGIGINDYQKCRKLNNAVKDVIDFKNLLLEKYDFQEENILLLKNEEATRENIFNTLRNFIPKLEPIDNFIFYFSGHGELDKLIKQGHWIPVEAEINAWHQYISNSEIKNYLEAFNCLHLFLIVDSCFSGALFQSKNTKKLEIERLEKEPSRWALTAGRNELVDDGEPGINSPFATWLLNILRNNDKSLSISSLSSRLKELVISNSKQTPRCEPLTIKGHEGGEFIFHLCENEAQKEERIWLNAISENTERGYHNYLTTYRRGKYSTDARTKLKDLAIETDYKKAKKIGKLYAYHDFVAKYEDESHSLIDEIEDLIKKLEFEVPSPPPQYNTPKIETPTIIIPKKFDFEPEMIFVKGGTFNREFSFEESTLMGFSKSTKKGIQKVTLSDFSIGKYPVTQAQWQAVMGNNPSHFKGDNLPVETVSWDDCQNFIKKLNSKTEGKYRLPTEAEWEFAARGGNDSKGYEYSGSDNIDDVAWYWENSGDNKLTGDWDYSKIQKNNCKTHPVGQKKANELGIHDMSGNVWEWCSDWYGEYSNKASLNPKGAESGSARVMRGGSWTYPSGYCRPTFRSFNAPTDSYFNNGFRLVLFSPSV